MTANIQPDFRDHQYTFEELKSIYLIAGGIVIGLIGVVIGAVLFAGDNPLIHDVTGYWTNLGTEILSVVVTILVLDRLAERREVKRLQERLTREAASRSNERAKAAIDDLRYYGWLTGKNGLLRGAYLRGANLAGAYLRKADMQVVYLRKANLHTANLKEANLQEAYLRRANLEETDLRRGDLQKADLTLSTIRGANWAKANLRGAILRRANLQRADLKGVNLQSVDLRGANLRSVNLLGAIFDNYSIMPNGKPWHDGMNLEMFTNPDDPNFWKPPEQA